MTTNANSPAQGAASASLSDGSEPFRQIPLELTLRPAMDAADFLVAAPNRDAVSWIDRWPDWPSPFVIVWGPAGSGKTHLVQVWRRLSGAKPVFGPSNTEDIAADPVLCGPSGPWVIDDVDHVLAASGQEGQHWLLHLLNRARDDGSTVLLTATQAPSTWTLALADLSSRLKAAPSSRIGDPDDELVGALLLKLFADRQIRPTTEVLTFALRRLPRDFATVRRFVAAADRRSLAGKRPVTIPLIRDILSEITQAEKT